MFIHVSGILHLVRPTAFVLFVFYPSNVEEPHQASSCLHVVKTLMGLFSCGNTIKRKHFGIESYVALEVPYRCIKFGGHDVCLETERDRCSNGDFFISALSKHIV